MNTFGIVKIDQSKLREEVYAALRDAFTRGEFAPGAVLNLRGLAEQLGTSMTPVREAVRRLVAEGALIDTPSRTLQVPPFDQDRMLDLKRARVGMETMVLGIAMDNMDDATIDVLETIIQTSPDTAQTGPDLKANLDFHFTLYRKSNSAVMLPLIEALWLQYGAYLHLIIRHENALRVDEHEFHKDMIQALRRNDREAAAIALKTDIESSFNYLAAENLGKLTLITERKSR
ncbi:MAG: GntR family transcriptional regulator [Rhodobacteraceae bacterium]|nr:GntR family transcriptional regulator [Paracoccaceae bacterium]